MTVLLDEAVRARPEKLAASARGQARAVLRAKIVLAAADGLSNGAFARRFRINVNTVRKWRGRFARRGVDGLKDAARSGRPCRYNDLLRVAVVAAATSAPAGPATTWTHAAIAEQVANTLFAPISATQVGWILADLDLKPHKVTG